MERGVKFRSRFVITCLCISSLMGCGAVRTDVSDECVAYIYSEQKTTLTVG
jgi:hypothetical protein